MSALKEFANFITLNMANLVATYDRLLLANNGDYSSLPTDSRIAQARRLIKTVAEACESETPDPILSLIDARISSSLTKSGKSELPSPLLEVECLGQTLNPVVTNLEAGKFLWQMLAEARTAIFNSISLNSAPVSSLAIPPELPITNNIMANQAVETSSFHQLNLLQILIDNLPEYIYAKDTESRFILLNTATAHLLGASSVDEVVGKTDFDFFPPELAHQFRADEHDLMQSGQSLLNQEESLVDSATGQTRWNLTSKIPLRDNEGKIVGLVGINRDITERKQTEEALTGLLAQHNTILENVPFGIAHLANRQFIWMNSRMTDMFGYTLDEVKSVTTESFYPSQEDFEQLGKDAYPLLSQGKMYSTERLMKRKDGSLFWCALIGKAIPGGQVPGSIWILQDITERKRAEEALRENEQKLRAIYEGSNDAVMLLTEQGFFDCNPKTLEIFGFKTAEEFISTHPAHISPPFQPDGQESLSASLAHIQTAYHQGYDRFEWVHRRTNNQDFPAEVSLSAFDFGGQKVLQATVRDITERKQLEQQIQGSLERLTRQIETITTVAQQIARTQSLNDLFYQVIDLMQTQFDFYHTQIYTIVEDEMVLQTGTGEIGRRLKESGHKIPLSAEQSLVVRAVRERTPVLVTDVSQEPTWLPNPLLPETKTELAVPITLGTEVLGVLDVQSDEVGALSEEDRLLLIGLCGQIAIFMETRRVEAERVGLLAEAERRTHREQTIREITEQMRAATNLEQLVKITARELGQRLPVGHALVELGIEAETPDSTPAPNLANNNH